jgi:hypothetical protein
MVLANPSGVGAPIAFEVGHQLVGKNRALLLMLRTTFRRLGESRSESAGQQSNACEGEERAQRCVDPPSRFRIKANHHRRGECKSINAL